MKQTIITALLALVAVTGQAQVHYRLEGNIGRPDVTDTLSVIENRGFEKHALYCKRQHCTDRGDSAGIGHGHCNEQDALNATCLHHADRRNDKDKRNP